jgi:hypothetical protein
MHRLPLALLVATALLACAGCPKPPAEDSGTGQTGSQASATRGGTSSTEEKAGTFEPSEPIPTEGALLSYAGLKLGMSSAELAQVYNAPEGRGKDFDRIIASYDAVAQHFITFDARPGQPQRRLIAAFYRDRLYWIVDRREGLTAAQAKAWYDECAKAYGPPARESVPGAQWTWEQAGGVKLTFTQDNASETAMTANVVLVHQPTQTAAHAYLAEWEAAHPQEGKPAQ